MQSKAKTRTVVTFAARAATAGCVAFLGLNAQASASENDVAASFGNTVLVTYPDGRNQRIWMHEDGTYEGIGRRGTASSGKWSIKDDKVCLKQAKPFPAPINYCTKFPEKSDIGVTWTGKDLAGVPIVLKLVKGIDAPRPKN